jgi:hypothetical protein
MKIPTLSGLIRRRILVNYRVEPEILQRILPSPFQPKLIHGYGIAGICLIRLEQIHPRLVPVTVGFSSENAAHRIAVTWNENGESREGVYIPRRDTSSYVTVTAGGRIFPGMHHHSRFEAHEDEHSVSIAMHNAEDNTHLEFEADYAAEFQPDSIFKSINEASAFFEGGSIGYSVTALPSQLDTIELRTFDWRLRPLAVKRVVSSFYENGAMFPKGSISFDCALVMKNLAHEWHAQEPFSIQPAQN